MVLRLRPVSLWRERRLASAARAGRLYVRDRCGLCEAAKALLRPFESQNQLRLELVDIAGEPDLLHRYGLTIPVLAISGGDELAWPFNAADVRGVLL